MSAIRWEAPIKTGVRIVTVLVVSILTAWPARGEGFALIVGVNDCPAFRLLDGSRPRPLQGAQNDADALADFLVHQAGFPERHVLVLKGSEATREKIRSAFVRLAKQARAEDRFVFHYSGHGTQIPDVRPFDEPDGRDEALCPWDATANGDNLIRDDELAVWLDDLPARRITVILDCCHAGTGTKDAGGDPEIVSRFLPMRQVVRPSSAAKHPWRELRDDTKEFGREMTSFFACQPAQEAYERRFLDRTPPHRAGQFTHFFLEGLRENKADRNRDGLISNGELLGYISHRLDESFNQGRPASSGHQNPAIETSTTDGAVLVGRRGETK
jgi:uncharacterized caspase-like protein